ncbi:hypothetical protein ACFL04_00265 [Patescibacteria group bacterium]
MKHGMTWLMGTVLILLTISAAGVSWKWILMGLGMVVGVIIVALIILIGLIIYIANVHIPIEPDQRSEDSPKNDVIRLSRMKILLIILTASVLLIANVAGVEVKTLAGVLGLLGPLALLLAIVIIVKRDEKTEKGV